MPQPEIISIHNVVGQGVLRPFLNERGELDHIEVRWLAFTKSDLQGIAFGPSTLTYYSTAKIPFTWLSMGAHGMKRNGSCLCEQRECREFSVYVSPEDVEQRLAYLAKIETQRQKARDYNAKRKAEKA